MSKKAAAAAESAKGAGMGAQEAIHKNKDSPTAAVLPHYLGQRSSFRKEHAKNNMISAERGRE